MKWIEDYRNHPTQKVFFTASLWAAGVLLAFFVVMVMRTPSPIWELFIIFVSLWMLGTLFVVNALGVIYWRTMQMHTGWQRIAWVLYLGAFAIAFWQAEKYSPFSSINQFFESFATAVIVMLIIGGALLWLNWVVSYFRRDKS